MVVIFTILFFVLNLVLIIGYFKPEWVLYRLNVQKTIGRVLLIYGTLSVVTVFSFILFVIPDFKDSGTDYDTDMSGLGGQVRGLAEEEFQMPPGDEDTDELTAEAEPADDGDVLSEDKKREILKKLDELNQRAKQEARELNPALPRDFSDGDQIILIKKTSVILRTGSEVEEPGKGKILQLTPGSYVKFLNLNNERQSDRFSVEIFTPDGISRGTGWITQPELQKQWGDKELELELQKQIASELREEYRNKLLRDYGISAEQLRKIESERGNK